MLGLLYIINHKFKFLQYTNSLQMIYFFHFINFSLKLF